MGSEKVQGDTMARLGAGFRLGPWTVRPDRGLLEGPEGARHLEPKQMDLLVYLAARAPDVATKIEIFEAVWPGSHVAEVGLKRNVSQLRRALRDQARAPRFIKTIPKRGYSLLVDPQPLDSTFPAAGDESIAVDDPGALCRRGRQFLSRSKQRSIKSALEMFEQAARKAPRYAPAYSGKADCHSYLVLYYGGSRRDREQADEASRRAVELDPESAEAHVSRGLALSASRRWVEAEQEFKSAVALDPNRFEVHYFYGRACFIQGKFDKAVQLFERASRIEAEDFQALSLAAFTYRVMGQTDRVVAVQRRTLANVERHLQIDPDDSRALYVGATALLDLGQHDRGLEMVQRSLAIDPEDPYIVYGGACFYAQAGRLEQAIQCFERAVETGFVNKEWIDRDSQLDPIRDDPRFRDAVEKLE